MAVQSTIVRHNDLLNRLVLNRNTMEELGQVDVLWMQPEAHRILGFVCQSGLMGTRKVAFNLAQIDTLGADSILVQSSPVETDAGRVRQLESLIHCEVWSDAGEKIGKIADCLFNLQTGAIREYLLVSNGWNGLVGGVYCLPPKKIISFGSKRVLVAAVAVKTFQMYRGGIQQKLSDAGEFFRENYTEVTQEVRIMADRAEDFTERAKERWLKLTEQAKKQAHVLAKQVKERAQVLNQHLREETQILSEQARNKGQDFAEQVKERTQTLGDQVHDNTQPWVEQVRNSAQNLAEQVQDTLDPIARTKRQRPSSEHPLETTRQTTENSELIPPEDLEDDEPWI